MKAAFKEIANAMHSCDPSASFCVEFWDGDAIRFGETPRVKLCLRSSDCAARILKNGFLGFGESYESGDLEVENDLAELLRLGLGINFTNLGLSLRQKCRYALLALRNADTLRRSPKNIAFHYDLGEDFYKLYLDSTMAYSCAYFRDSRESLEQAQRNKYEHIARKLMLGPDTTLLDIGCGWGGMLIYAAQRYGTKGLGVTLSKNQYRYAADKIRELGLGDHIDVRMQDYRQLDGSFDRIVSIGMFEHVGDKFIPLFFKKVSRLLKSGGLGLLHTIGKEVRSGCDPWIARYIFPGGYLPTLAQIAGEMGKSGLCVLDVENLRLHYAETLDRWQANFERNLHRVTSMFGEAFARRWRLFLVSSAAGFRYGESRLFQVQFSNGLNNALPMTRDYLYAGKGTGGES